MESNTIRIASAILVNTNEDLLVVRKKNSSFYMLPGGKIENDETHLATLLRELKEELGMVFSSSDFDFLGMHETNAANEKNTMVQGHIFLLTKRLNIDKLSHQAEIEEALWISKSNYKSYQLAHLLKEFALPRWLNNFQ